MTDKELTIRAKTLKGNLILDGEKISFSDACKIVLISEFYNMEKNGQITEGTLRELVGLFPYSPFKRFWMMFWS
jgi:hypothetical protein